MNNNVKANLVNEDCLVFDLVGTLSRWASGEIFGTKRAEERKDMTWTNEQYKAWMDVKRIVFTDNQAMDFQTKYDEIVDIVSEYKIKLSAKNAAANDVKKNENIRKNGIDHKDIEIFKKWARCNISNKRVDPNCSEKWIMNYSIYYADFYNERYGTNFKPYYSRVNSKNITRAAENEKCLKYFKSLYDPE